MKKIALTLLLSTFALGLTAPAQAQSDGADLAALAFTSTDADSNGQLSMTEMRQQGALIFVSMDADENDSLTFDEFSSWGFGFQNFAEDLNRVGRYQTALRIVFDLWDHDKDGNVTAREHREGVVTDTIRADMDNNGRLNQPEFLGAFVLNVALRAALKAD